MNSRQRINRRRGFIALGTLLLVLCLGSLLCWVIATEMQGAMPLLIIAIVSLGVLQRFDVCPCCGKNISLLPNGGFLSWPHLSLDVKCCPFCGDDYSTGVAQNDEGTPS
ncbi:MAG: hypothetical protein IAE77_13915 [Prosthecobacter sp.]|jgi:hypothetical protein|uniref:hypothetical protein n=1 Tax=Prosthecobacter sp. TaxID=1965333 RepID=UPI0019F427E9|nr:hypothetical protein [Prosthecobacter sp.]MBE2284548.1 hypothetical protein [Prosthecobacter sp.]